jgi:hypothetical protein
MKFLKNTKNWGDEKFMDKINKVDDYLKPVIKLAA